MAKRQNLLQFLLIVLLFFVKEISSFTTAEIFPSNSLSYVPCEAQMNNTLYNSIGIAENIHSNISHSSSSKLVRKKRFTVRFPTALGANSRIVANFYINLPLKQPGTVFGPMTIQAAYTLLLPNFNFEFITGGKSLSDRFTLFKAAEDLVAHFGADGRSCILRAICERSEYHVMVDGLIGETITLLLEIEDTNNNATYREYQEAQEHGGTVGKCYRKYPKCPFSIFSIFDR